MTAEPTREERDRSFHRVQKYYGIFPEWGRLERPHDGALEFEVNRAWISRYLPKPGARILDIGGGPGRYAIWLAEHGYNVTLADLSSDLLAIAREKAAEASVELEAIVEANAIDLSMLPDESFDAALCMGPMYHLLDEGDRHAAAGELLRVTSSGGTVFVAFLNRLQALRVVINPDILERMRESGFSISTPSNFNLIRRWHEDGVFISPAPGVFTDSYFAHPEEIKPLIEAAGFETLELVSSESIADPVQKHLAAFKDDEPELYEWVLERLIAIANQPSIVGNAGHLLYIGRKP
jgi:ubiquinone/menaquinone biosynthesis C-methylase UbiE